MLPHLCQSSTEASDPVRRTRPFPHRLQVAIPHGPCLHHVRSRGTERSRRRVPSPPDCSNPQGRASGGKRQLDPRQDAISLQGGLKPSTAKIFAPFNGYSYQKKQADAVLSLFGKISEARKVPKPRPAILDKSNSDRDDTDAKGPLSLLSGPAASPNPQPLPACEHGGASQHHEPKLLDIQDPAVVSEAESTSELIRRPSPRSFVESWRHDVGRAGPEEVEEPWKVSSPDEDLITFDETDQEIDILSATLERTEVSSIDHGLKTSGSMDRFNVSDNLICLDDEPQSGPSHPWPSEMHQQDLLGLDALTEQQLQWLSALSSPQDPRVVSPEEQQTLLDTDKPLLAYFELRHEGPRWLMKTMSQRASCDGAHRFTPRRSGSASPLRETSNDISPAPQSIPAKRKTPASLPTSKTDPSSCSDVADSSRTAEPEQPCEGTAVFPRGQSKRFLERRCAGFFD